MAVIDSLKYVTSIDAEGWKKGIDDGLKEFEAFDARINQQLDRLKLPTLAFDQGAFLKQGGNVAAASEDIAGEVSAAFVPIGSQIKQALQSAAKPIQGFASSFGQQFAQVAPVIEKLSIRIDDAMRFPGFVKRYENFFKGFRKAFGINFSEAEREVAGAAVKMDAVAGKMIMGFEKVAEAARSKIAPIAGAQGYGRLEAVHVDAKASFSSYLAGLDEVKSQAIDKMKAMADAVQNATGKGSRTGRKQAKQKAADLDQTISSAPARDNVTPATPEPKLSPWKQFAEGLREVRTQYLAIADASQAYMLLSEHFKPLPPSPPVSGWKMMGGALRDLVGDTTMLAKTFGFLAEGQVKGWAVGVNALAGANLAYKKVMSTVSTFGSVAKATFGKALVALPKIDINPITNATVALKGVSGAANGVGQSIKGMAGQVLMAFGVFGLAFKAVDFFKKGVTGAASLNETLNKTDAVLGSASAGVKAFADDLGSKFGIVKQDTLDVAAGFGGLYKGIGKQSGQALQASTIQMTKMAADLSSFANLSFAESGQALRSALSGEQSDKLKQLGVDLSEDTVKAYAFTHGIAAFGSELTSSQKLAARTGVIMNGLKDAQGDLDATSGSTANQFRKFTGNLQNMAVMIGTAVMPAIDSLLSVYNAMAEQAMKAFAGTGDAITPFIDTIKYAYDVIEAGIKNPQAAFEVFKLIAIQSLSNVGAYLETLGPNIGIVAGYIANNWTKLIGDAFHWTLGAFKNLFANFVAIGDSIREWISSGFTSELKIDWTPLSKGFQATAAEFPELIKPALTDMSKEIADAAKPIFDAVQKKADDAKAKAAAAAAAAAKKAGMTEEAVADLDKKAKSAKEGPAFAGALQKGSVEAYSATLAANATKGDRAVANNTARIAQLQAQQLNAQREMLRLQAADRAQRDANMRQT